MKKIRTFQHVKSPNRSRIDFIWRSLAYLVEKGILEENGSRRPKSYKIKNRDIDLEEIIAYAKKERSDSDRSI